MSHFISVYRHVDYKHTYYIQNVSILLAGIMGLSSKILTHFTVLFQIKKKNKIISLSFLIKKARLNYLRWSFVVTEMQVNDSY